MYRSVKSTALSIPLFDSKNHTSTVRQILSGQESKDSYFGKLVDFNRKSTEDVQNSKFKILLVCYRNPENGTVA